MLGAVACEEHQLLIKMKNRKHMCFQPETPASLRIM